MTYEGAFRSSGREQLIIGCSYFQQVF